MILQVGDIIEGKVVDFGSDGEGIIKLDAFPIFVPYVLKNEVVKARVNFVNRNYAFADVIDILNPSNDRIKPKCTYFSKCGGCDMQMSKYSYQLEVKRASVERAIRKISGQEIVVSDVIPSCEWEYRNKLSLPFGFNTKSKRVSLGYYEKMSHKVVPIKWCPLNGEWAASLIEIVSAWANDNSISVYNEEKHQGLLRHLTARLLSSLSICIVINGSELPFVDDLIDRLSRKFEGYSLYLSSNTKKTNVILGDNVKLLFGEETEQDLGKFSAYISPLSFLQVNNYIRDKIYDDVCEKIQSYNGNIIELYSGAGLLTAQIATRLETSKIVSVEIEPSATMSANELHKKLGLNNRIININQDAKKFMMGLKNGEGLLILDPPRRGCDKEVLDIAKDKQIEKIVYISCNPQTLARDIAVLQDSYFINYIQPYDMFPQTAHVETVVLMSLIKH